jgi:hypothetical protein
LLRSSCCASFVISPASRYAKELGVFTFTFVETQPGPCDIGFEQLKWFTSMVEGFWIVQFEGVRGNGSGVIVLLKGHVLGGDSGFVYTGAYESDGKTLLAQVSVRNFLPEVPSVLGVQGDVDLVLKGTVSENIIKAKASLANSDDVIGLAVKLTRVSNLPATWR